MRSGEVGVGPAKGQEEGVSGKNVADELVAALAIAQGEMEPAAVHDVKTY